MPAHSYRSPFSVGDVFNHTFALDRLIAVGSMAEVWAARHVRTGDRVALKITRHDRRHWAARLEREYQILSTIQHPAVVRCLGRDLTPAPTSLLYIVLELVEGQPLSRLLHARRKSSPRIARAVSPQKLNDWFAPVLGALEELNRLGIVHRDLKPGNIVIDEKGAGKIIDLNLGKMAGRPPLTDARTIGGSGLYSGPEQYQSLARADGRADTFAIAAILVEALSGVPLRAFESPPGTLDRELIRSTLRGGPAPGDPATGPGTRFCVAADLTGVLLRSLSPDPQQRPDSPRLLLSVLSLAGGHDAMTVERRLSPPPPVPQPPPIPQEWLVRPDSAQPLHAAAPNGATVQASREPRRSKDTRRSSGWIACLGCWLRSRLHMRPVATRAQLRRQTTATT
jgi:eukaryotic-like serine/threonine-protein kinase